MNATITYDMPFEDYCQIDAVNSHAVIWGMRPHTMAHMRAYLDGKMESESTDLRFGRALHHKILEPKTFTESWPIAKPCCTPIASGPRKGAPCGSSSSFASADRQFWFCGTHAKSVDATPVSEFVTDDEVSRLDAVEAELKRTGRLEQFQRPGWSECVIEFILHGIRCKARLDRLSKDYGQVLDIKKCQVGKANASDFEAASSRYRYYVQAAFYCEAVYALSGDYPRFAWIVIEDKPPHCSNIINADPNFVLPVGRQLIKDTLAQFNRATERNDWHGHTGKDIAISGGIADWELARFRQEFAGQAFEPMQPRTF